MRKSLFYQMFFNCVEFKLPFSWAFASWGLLCGSVALQYTWNYLTFSPPLLWGGTVHGLCHSSSYVSLGICIYSWNALIFSKTNRVSYYDQVLPRKLLFISVIMLRLEMLHCCVDQSHEHAILGWIWWPITWSTRWDWSSMTDLTLAQLNKVITQHFYV